jgi:hypothetical protein
MPPCFVQARIGAFERKCMKISLRYRLDRTIRKTVMRVMSWITRRSAAHPVDLRRQEIKKILLVRGIFHMGDAMLVNA